MVKKKKGQMQMTETIAVLFIFFVLIIFGLVFYSRYQQIALQEKKEELLAARAMDITLKALFLPEIICSKGEAEAEDNCFDLMKLRHANETFQKYLSDYYYNLFSYASITVHQLYPPLQDPLVVYSREKPDFTAKEATYFVVALKDQVNGEIVYNFGYVTVEVYS